MNGIVMGLKLHHVAYKVKSIKQSIEFWKVIGGILEMPPITIAAINIKVCFMLMGDDRVELVESDETHNYPDHVCFLCDDFEDRIKNARQQNGIVVQTPVISEAFNGKRMSFIYYKNFGLIEWIENESV